MTEAQLLAVIRTCVTNAYRAGQAAGRSNADLPDHIDYAQTVLLPVVQGMVRTAYFEGSQAGALAQVTP